MAEDPSDPPRWQRHGERTVYEHPWVRLAQMDVTAPDGRRWWHHVVRLHTVAIALVLDGDDRVLMLRRHRFLPDTVGWELPGGVVADGESGVDTARRGPTRRPDGARPVRERTW